MSTLAIVFTSEISFNNAIKHFDEVSNFSPNEINEEFKTISFEVSDEYDADITEINIENELNKTAYIQNYYYEYID